VRPSFVTEEEAVIEAIVIVVLVVLVVSGLVTTFRGA